MKIRTKESLSDFLDSDLAWRKKELTNLRNNIRTSKDKSLPTSLRAGTVLLYAHWEGFVKNAAETYLVYVKSHKLKINELDKCFLALAIKQKINEFDSTSKSTKHIQFIDYVLSPLDERAKINEENVIKTNSNLNFSTLKELLTTIGIDCTPYELKENLIDEKLLNYRNTIAHGQHLLVDKDEYDILHSEVLNMIIEIKNQIQNAVTLEKFKK